jgi:nucleotide-binding universal stress UspA family protein
MDTEAKRTIVVGVDGSPGAERALEWAMDEAHRREMTLLLVHGVEVGVATASPYGSGMVLEQLEESGQQVLNEAMAAVRANGLEAAAQIEVGSSAHALIEASRGAAMLVVGNRGHGGFAGLLLGSVSAACVHHAHCPVVVIRPEEHKAA